MQIDLTVEVTREDNRALVSFVQKQARKKHSRWKDQSLNLLFWIGVGLVTSFLVNYSGSRMHLPSAIGAAVVVLAVLVSYLFWYTRKLQTHMLPEAGGIILGRHSYQFRNGGIFVASPHSTSQLTWSGIKSLEETQAHFFLMMDKCVGCIFPKRAFAGDSHAVEFKAMIIQQLGSSGSST